MILILSAQYVNESIKQEIGEVPISFVPIANKRIYYYQIQVLTKLFPNEKIYISLPNDYVISKTDQIWFEKNNISILCLDCVTSFGEEIYFILKNKVKPDKVPLKIIFGDSVFSKFPLFSDFIGTMITDLEPKLPIEQYGLLKDTHWNGVFCFSDTASLIDHLVKENFDYFRGFKSYSFTKEIIYELDVRSFSITNVASYFFTRTFFTSERAFNTLKIQNSILQKFSQNKNKIIGEANWYKSFPNHLKHYIPQFLNENDSVDGYTYSIEYIPALPLSEIFVYGRQSIIFWQRIFNKIQEYFRSTLISSNPLNLEEKKIKNELFILKTKERVQNFVKQFSIDYTKNFTINNIELPSLEKILDNLERRFEKIQDISGYIHGDLCFSNILYDSRSRSIKLIDPRGIGFSGSSPLIIGTLLYDYAKLSHSILGLYDHIIAKQFNLIHNKYEYEFTIHTSDDVLEIQNIFLNYNFFKNVSGEDIESILPFLFFSMLPLHSDDEERQFALFANALRLYAKHYN